MSGLCGTNLWSLGSVFSLYSNLSWHSLKIQFKERKRKKRLFFGEILEQFTWGSKTEKSSWLIKMESIPCGKMWNVNHLSQELSLKRRLQTNRTQSSAISVNYLRSFYANWPCNSWTAGNTLNLKRKTLSSSFVFELKAFKIRWISGRLYLPEIRLHRGSPNPLHRPVDSNLYWGELEKVTRISQEMKNATRIKLRAILKILVGLFFLSLLVNPAFQTKQLIPHELHYIIKFSTKKIHENAIIDVAIDEHWTNSPVFQGGPKVRNLHHLPVLQRNSLLRTRLSISVVFENGPNIVIVTYPITWPSRVS